MVFAAFVFATMGVCVKKASVWFGTGEIVFWRGVIGIALIWAIARYRRISISTRHPGMHAWRSTIGVSSMGAWFYAIAYLPLATAMTLNYMSSVWIAAFLVGSALLAWAPRHGRDDRLPRPPLQGALVGTVLAGFAGVVLALKPTVGAAATGVAGLVGLLSGMGSALAYMQVVALARIGEPEIRTVFYFMVGSTVAGALVTLGSGGFAPWHGVHTLWLLPVGLLAALGQIFMTLAYSSAKTPGGTLLVANLQYSGIIFAAFYSMLLFNDTINASAWLGIALIVASGIAATVLRQRTR